MLAADANVVDSIVLLGGLWGYSYFRLRREEELSERVKP
jgi:hypothetical protein